MEQLFMTLNDIVVICFDLLIFTRIIELRRDTAASRTAMCLGCILIVATYFVAVNICGVPVSVAAFVCMALPSLILFWILSKYKDGRFFLSFCFVDTISLIFGFIARWVGVMGWSGSGKVTLVASIVLFSAFYLIGRPYFPRFHKLLQIERGGWLGMAAATGVIYLSLVFCAAYPKPLVERVEYGPSYFMLCLVIMCCYGVFIQSIVKTGVIYRQNEQLLREKKFHRIAYTDALTGLYNRAAYLDRISEIDRDEGKKRTAGMVVFDINFFKQVNDGYGHNMGDQVLCAVGQVLKEVFKTEPYTVFRMGGDEFAVIATPADRGELEMRMRTAEEKVAAAIQLPVTVTVAAGLALQDGADPQDMEQLMERADQAMYCNKRSFKEHT